MSGGIRRLSGWGGYPAADCRIVIPGDAEDVARQMNGGSLIARGAGRAYGDSALNPETTLSTSRLNHMLAFDPRSGELTAEAGVMLADILEVFLPRGWFPPVSPGTKFVTLGGMIAADVHGKNHHVDGSFGAHVSWLDLMLGDGTVKRCSPWENFELFRQTVGGMGLTGVILRAAFRLRPVETAWMRQETIVAPELRSAMDAFERADDWTYSVAWIDCLARGASRGRSLVYRGEHAALTDLDPDRFADPFRVPRRAARRVPLTPPSWTLNRFTVRAFNNLYFSHGARAAVAPQLVDWDRFFYPLDAILDWNRIYGRKGFVQFQCVLPPDRAEAGLSALLEATASAGMGSFLAVLKKLGAQESFFSFPMEGYTLALDFPATPRALAFLERLDAIVLDHGGRLYLAKDARMSRDLLDASDPRAKAFREARDGAARKSFNSLQSERLGL